MEIPRWTLPELVTRYELEPSLTDVFVEGQFDQEVLSCAYNHATKGRRALYTADAFEIDDELFEKHNLTKGNKQKLLILCRELSSVNNDENVRFIVDRDTDHWFGDLEKDKGLLWTEYCDMENYFFDETFSKELIIDAGRAKIADWTVFYESFKRTLRNLYAVRAAARELDIALNYMEFEKFLSISLGTISFDADTYLDRTLLKSNVAKRREEMRNALARWIERLDGDPRLSSRGHDFIVLVAWSIMKFRGVKSLSDDVVTRILVLLVPRDVNRFDALL